MSHAIVGLALVVGALTACQSTRGADSPAPDVVSVPNTIPPRDGRIYASVEFVDAIRDEDLEWLRNEGFEIVRIFRESNRVTVRIPDDYSKGPKDANPRIRRVDVQMR